MELKEFKDKAEKTNKEKNDAINKFEVGTGAAKSVPLTHAQIESMESLRAEIFELQEQNRMLDK